MTINEQIKQHIQEDLDQLEITLIKWKKKVEGLEKFIEETREALNE